MTLAAPGPGKSTCRLTDGCFGTSVWEYWKFAWGPESNHVIYSEEPQTGRGGRREEQLSQKECHGLEFNTLDSHKIHIHGPLARCKKLTWRFYHQARAKATWASPSTPVSTEGLVVEVFSLLDWKVMGHEEACTILHSPKREKCDIF